VAKAKGWVSLCPLGIRGDQRAQARGQWKRENLIKVIIPHFNTYNLVGNKNLNFLIWSQIVSLINPLALGSSGKGNKKHLTSDGLILIKSLKDKLNKWD
jgi:hypothetical protein